MVEEYLVGVPALPVPKKEHYESDYANLADGDLHEILLEYKKETIKTYEGHERWVMVFAVIKERMRGGAVVSFEPPKIFETSASDFADLAIKAAGEGEPAFWINAQYDSRRKRWNIIPSNLRYEVLKDVPRKK